MLTRVKIWQEKQKRASERRPSIRLDACSVEPLGERRGYNVVIDGFNLHPVISPPRITVGGVTLEDLQFQKDGRQVRGVLKQKPHSTRVLVDYGFARAEMKGGIKWVESKGRR